MTDSTTLSHGISVIDTGLMRPRFAAAYLLQQDGRAAFVETGTARNVDALLAALAAAELDVADVDYVVVTHVHLDHAGGAGALMAELPNARLVVHPRGARHMIDPSKLIAGATAVYGEDLLQQNYGTILPTPAERVVEAPDDFVLELRGRPLRFLDTPGHAKHHFCVWDDESRGAFTGDTFGLGYPELATGGTPFVFPTTSPVQFEPDRLKASMDRVMALDPAWIYLTHFGRADDAGRVVDDLRADIDAFVALATEAPVENRHTVLAERLEQRLVARLRKQGSQLDDEALTRALALDVELNAQGLEHWLDSQPRGC